MREIVFPIAVSLITVLFSVVMSLLVEHPERLLPSSEISFLGALPFILFFAACVFLVCTLRRDTTLIMWFSLFSFIIRCILGVVLSVTFLYDDERAIHWSAVEGFAARGYGRLVMWLYDLFGHNVLIPKILNAFLSVLTALLIYDLMRVKFAHRSRAALLAFYSAAFLPPLVIFGALNLKEMSTAFATVLVFWSLQVPNWTLLMRGIVSIAACVLVYWFRGAWAIFPFLGWLTFLLLGSSWKLTQLFSLRRVVLLAAIVSLLFIGFRSMVQDVVAHAQFVLTRPYSIQTFERVAESASVGRYLNTGVIWTPRNILILFLRAFYSPSPLRFLFEPDVSTAIEAMVMLTWYLVVPLSIVGVAIYWRDGRVISWAITAIAIFLVASQSVALGGDPFRHRVPSFPLLYLLAGASWEHRRCYRWLHWLWFGALLLFSFFYLQLRI